MYLWITGKKKMSIHDEGYIKFNCKLSEKKIFVPDDILIKVNYWRNRFKLFRMIGVLDNGIGFGNISYNINNEKFYISGSSTGEISELNNNHIAKVTYCNVEQNMVECEGKLNASSESLSHYSIYKSSIGAKSVIHIHCKYLWNKYMSKLPTTAPDAYFGSVELANELKRLSKNTTSNIIIAAGHEDGIFSYAESIDKAAENLLKLY